MKLYLIEIEALATVTTREPDVSGEHCRYHVVASNALAALTEYLKNSKDLSESMLAITVTCCGDVIVEGAGK